MTQQEKYQKAQDDLKKVTDNFKAKNCAGLSADACGAKMNAHRDELLAGFVEAGSDFIPVYVEYTIDGGRPIAETFKNAPGGK